MCKKILLVWRDGGMYERITCYFSYNRQACEWRQCVFDAKLATLE